MKHLEINELVWLYQKSCIWGTQTQLLQRYSDVFEAITEGIIIDTICLDFVKAFNKVDQNILLKTPYEYLTRYFSITSYQLVQ